MKEKIIISKKIQNSNLTETMREIMLMFIDNCCFHFSDINNKLFNKYRVISYRKNENGCFRKIREYFTLDNLRESSFFLNQLIKMEYILKFKVKSRLKCIPQTIFYLTIDSFILFDFSRIYKSYQAYLAKVEKEKKNMINYIKSCKNYKEL